ncbi:MAG: preprotein translocase subunit YajC [Rickettsiales bacterium]
MSKHLAFLLASAPFSAFAQAASEVPADVPTQSPLMSMLPLLMIFFVFYFVLIKPQQKRLKQQQATLAALKKGDKIVTAGGIVGKITKLGSSDTMSVEIASGVEITVIKATITGLYSAPSTVPAEKKKASKAAGEKNDNAVPSRESVANDN